MKHHPELAELAQEIAREEGLPLDEATRKAARELDELMRLASGQWAEAIDPDDLGHVMTLALFVIERAYPAHATGQPAAGDVGRAAAGLRRYLCLLGWMDPDDEQPASEAPRPLALAA